MAATPNTSRSRRGISFRCPRASRWSRWPGSSAARSSRSTGDPQAQGGQRVRCARGARRRHPGSLRLRARRRPGWRGGGDRSRGHGADPRRLPRGARAARPAGPPDDVPGACRAVNPRLVYCATYGFCARGPYGDKPAYDDVIQAAAGLASLQAPLVGEPRYVPTIVADKTSSLAVLSAVLSALFHRERTGEGQAIEVPMFETVVAYVMVEHLYGETFVPPLETAGYKRILNRWRRPFRTRDGYLAVVPYTDADWRAFFAVAGRPDLLADPRFTTLESRLANIEVLYEELSKIVATRSSAEWLEALDRAGVPATIVNTLETLLTDPQLEATGFWQIVDHPSEGTLRLPAIPTTYSRTPGEIRRLPPRLGEHSLEVLREAGFGEAEIDAMLASGATSVVPSPGAPGSRPPVS